MLLNSDRFVEVNGIKIRKNYIKKNKKYLLSHTHTFRLYEIRVSSNLEDPL